MKFWVSYHFCFTKQYFRCTGIQYTKWECPPTHHGEGSIYKSDWGHLKISNGNIGWTSPPWWGGYTNSYIAWEYQLSGEGVDILRRYQRWLVSGIARYSIEILYRSKIKNRLTWVIVVGGRDVKHACNCEEVSSKSKRWPEAIEKSNIVYPRQGCLKAVS